MLIAGGFIGTARIVCGAEFLCNGWVSVCLSRHLTAAAAGLLLSTVQAADID